MRFIPIISLSILILLLTACSADTGSSVNASANLSQDQPHQDIPALPLTDSGLSLLVKDYTYTPKPQADPRVCLKIAFRQLCVPLCGRFGPDEGGVAGYVDRIGTKYTAKWGAQMAGMNFQTHPTPAENSFGFPIELVSDLKERMYQEDADSCIRYLNHLNDRDYRITHDEFFSLLDMTDETTKYMFNTDRSGYVFYGCDTDGDGIDELIAFEKDGRGTSSYIYMLTKGEEGYTYLNSNYLDDVRLFSLFQYENAFYYAASCYDDSAGTVNLQMFMLNRNFFKLSNIVDSICFNRTFDISEPDLLYRNENHPDIRLVQDYLGDILYDVVYANRAKETFHGDEWAYLNEERPFPNEDTDSWDYDTEDQAIDWSRMYRMDMNNDGNDEIFTKSPPGYQQPFAHRVNWYDGDFRPCPASVEEWEDEDYRSVDMWFKNINGKIVTFTLYQEIQSGLQYLIDARIQERDEHTILMDYMVVLEPTDIRVTEFGIGTDVSIYKPLIYQDPDLDKAFPYNLQDMAEVFLLKVQGPSVTIENNCDIPDDFTEILEGLLTDGSLDDLNSELGMELYRMNENTFHSRYGAYTGYAESTLEGGTQSVYQITLGSTDYFLLLQYNAAGKVGDLHIYQKAAGRLTYVITYQPTHLWAKVIEYSGKLYIAERPSPWYEYPRYLDSTRIHQLIPEGGQDILIDAVPETYQWQKIYDNQAYYGPAVTGYLEGIKTELMDLPYLTKEDAIYLGDETPEIDQDKLLRLGSVTSPYDTFYKIDFNNDQKDEYILKSKSYNSIYTGIYQFTLKGIAGLGYDEKAGGTLGRPVQLWFKEIEGKVFTFRLYYDVESYYYILNISLIEGTGITQVQTYMIVPKVDYIASYGCD